VDRGLALAVRLLSGAPLVSVGYVGDGVRRVVATAERRPQVQKCIGFIAPLTDSECVWRSTPDRTS